MIHISSDPDIFSRIGIIGAGAWGMSLALASTRAGQEVIIWSRDNDIVNAINVSHQNDRSLPGFLLPVSIRATTHLADIAGTDCVLLVPPAQKMRETLRSLVDSLATLPPVVSCSKGVEQHSLALMTQVMADELAHHPQAILSGPTFATDVAKDLPSAATIASTDARFLERIINSLGTSRFRLYASSDPIGVALGGSVKNVIALACGIILGRGLGDNARAALMTRGLVEIRRLGQAMGADPETFNGLSGLGDMILTCSSFQSRNLTFGYNLGQNQAVIKDLKVYPLVEGLVTSAAVYTLSQRHKVDMPICAAVHSLVNHHADLDATIDRILMRIRHRNKEE